MADELGPPTSWGVSAGRSLLPGRWPGDARFAVALSFDLDHETPWESGSNISPSVLSAAQYGTRVGLPRILRILQGVEFAATFFIPAIAAQRYPDETRDLIDRGYEVALHGMRHERPFTLSESEEHQMIGQSLEMFESKFGYAPQGYRAPSLDPSSNTTSFLQRYGLLYDSSLMADDDPYELLFGGKPSGMVEIPVEWTRDDATYFLMDRWSMLRPVSGVDQVGALWCVDWQRAREEGGVFQLTMHPDLIGQRSRIHILEELIRALAEDGTCWVATHADIAEFCLKCAQ